MNETNLKRAALRLYSLGDVDRQWMFNQLPGDVTNKLKGVLSELEEKVLAGNLDAQVIEHALNEITGADDIELVEQSEEKNNLVDAINAASADKVFKALEKEPIWIVALIMSVTDWKWRPIVMNFFSSEDRESITALITSKEIKVKAPVTEAILQQLARVLDRTDDALMDEGVRLLVDIKATA